MDGERIVQDIQDAKRELYRELAERRKVDPGMKIWSILPERLLSIIDGIDNAHPLAKEVAKTIVSMGFQLYLERDQKVRNTIPQEECKKLREVIRSKSIEYLGVEKCQRRAERCMPWEPIFSYDQFKFLEQIAQIVENIGGTPKDMIEPLGEAFGASWQLISHNREMSISCGYAILAEIRNDCHDCLLKTGDFMPEEEVRKKILEASREDWFQEVLEEPYYKKYIQSYLKDC